MNDAAPFLAMQKAVLPCTVSVYLFISPLLRLPPIQI